MSLNFPSSPADGDLSTQPNGITYMWQAAKERWISVESANALPTVISTGMVAPFPMDEKPSALWLYCNGQAVSRTEFATLFAAIGVTYGAGDGTTTFNLPDYRGQFLRGQDDGAGVDPDAAARTDRGDGTGGDNVGSKQADAAQQVTGTLIPAPNRASYNASTGAFGTGGSPGRAQADGGGVISGDVSFNNANSVSPNPSKTSEFETRPVNTYVRYYIFSGIYQPVNPDTMLEGTYQMTFHDALSGGNQSPTTVACAWTRVGNSVTVCMPVVNGFDKTGMNGASPMAINLPFPAAADAGAGGGIATRQMSWATRTQASWRLQENQQRCEIINTGDNTTQATVIWNDIDPAAILFDTTFTYIAAPA